MLFGRNIEKSLEQVGLLFINFSSFKSDTENSANFDTVSSKRGNFDAAQ